jgi:phosphoglycerate dehydrogenase-like enzyme
MPKPHALYLLSDFAFDLIYGPDERTDLAQRVEMSSGLVTAERYGETSQAWPGVEMIFSGWGMTPCDTAFLQRFPDLKIIFYGAGSIRTFVTDESWDRGVRVTSSAAANAVPVSEYSLSQILFGLKQGWQKSLFIRQHRHYPPHSISAGVYDSTVGLISLGLIGRLVAERLRTFKVKVIAHDPFVKKEDAERLGIELVSLEELFQRSDVVSCHTPNLPATKKMLQGRHFASMKNGATFLNTARGAVVDEEGMIGALRERPDLMAVLDVTFPEPPTADSPLYQLENVIITPHIAGSQGTECRRMGRMMVDELDLYLKGEPLQYEVTREPAHLLA